MEFLSLIIIVSSHKIRIMEPSMADRPSVKNFTKKFSESYKSSSALVRCIISGKIEQLKQMIKFEGKLIERTRTIQIFIFKVMLTRVEKITRHLVWEFYMAIWTWSNYFSRLVLSQIIFNDHEVVSPMALQWVNTLQRLFIE